MRRPWGALTVATLAIAALSSAGPSGASVRSGAPARLEEVSVDLEGESTVVRLTLSSPRRYQARVLGNPDRLVIDLEDTVYAWRRTPVTMLEGPLTRVRGGQFSRDVARVVLELRWRGPYEVHDEGGAIVVVLDPARPPDTRAAAAETAPPGAPPAGAEVPAPTGAGESTATRPAPAPPPATALPATPVSPEALPRTTRESRFISLEFKDADVVNLLRILAAESGSNIVIGDDVKGKMSISLRNVPWTLALETILEARGLQRIDRDGVIRIVSSEQLTKERDARARMEEAKLKAEAEIRTKAAEADLKEQEVQRRKRASEAATAEAIARGPLTEAAFRLSYADPGEVANTLQGLLGLGEGSTAIEPCRKITQEPGKREVKFGAGGGTLESGVRGPIAEPPFSQLFGPPRDEGPTVAPPPPPEEITSRRRAVRAHCATNTLFLRLHATDLERIRKLIREALDVPVPQIKIEARMEILDRNDLFAIGVQWGGGGVLAVDNRNAIVGRGFTSDPFTNPVAGGIPASGLGSLSNPNLQVGSQGGTVIPVSAQNGLPQGGNLINLPISALLNNAAATGGAGGLLFGIIGSRMNINLALEALRTQGKAFTLARPDVVTLENNLARIKLGEEIPYATVSSAGTQIQFKEAVLELSVIPMVVREPQRNRIKMTLIVNNNSRGSVVNLGGSGAPPAINKRSAETDVIVNEGDHLVIGGITTAIQQEEIRKVPVFGDIPVLGWLFKQRGTKDTRSELIIFITPSLLRSEHAQGAPPPSSQPRPPAK